MQAKNYWNKNEKEFGNKRNSKYHMHDKLPLIVSSSCNCMH